MAPSSSTPTAKIVKLDAAQSLTKPAGKKKTKSGGSSGTTTKSNKSADKKKRSNDDMEEDGDDSDDDDDDEDVDFVNVDLDFFGFVESDYQALKHLLTQLFHHDAKDLDMAGLADYLIAEEEDVGSAIKSDGEASDPLAFVGVYPWQSDKPHVESLRKYLLDKTSTHSKIQSILDDSNNQVGIVVLERLVNMPVQVVPPLLRIFNEELAAAAAPYSTFTHLLFVSRVFLATPEDFPEDAMDIGNAPQPKKKKKKGGNGSAITHSQADTFLYHLEDEIIASHAPDCWMEYKYTNAPSRGQMGAGEDFGVETRGRLALVERSKMSDIVSECEKVLSQ